MTDRELEEIRERTAAATPGPWFAHATDDRYSMNAFYVSVVPSETGFRHDGQHGLDPNSDEQANPAEVIAITLLQAPRLVEIGGRDNDMTDWKCDENTLFIAHSRVDMERLLAEVDRLKGLLNA